MGCQDTVMAASLSQPDRKVGGETLAFIESRHINMHCIEGRMVAYTAQLPVHFWYSRSQALQPS
eukprot:111364-Pelagomonas_calceolata.AAC.1